MNKKRKISMLLIVLVITTFVLQVPAQQAKSTFEIGDYIEFGRYNGEPILWRIIHIDDEGAPLLWSENIITYKPFDSALSGEFGVTKSGKDLWNNRISSTEKERREAYGSNRWSTSNLREWLNSEDFNVNYTTHPPTESAVIRNAYSHEPGFLSHFTYEERGAIKYVTNKTLLSEIDQYLANGGSEYHEYEHELPQEAVTNYDSAYFEWVVDQVFLLSIKELADYVDARGYRRFKSPTSKALEKDEGDRFREPGFEDYYWLRTPLTAYATDVRSVCVFGSVSEVQAFHYEIGVAPALYLNPNSVISTFGLGTKENPYEVKINLNEEHSELINNPSPWAVMEIEKAKKNNLTTVRITNNYQQSITREEFCELVVKLYEKLSGKKAELSSINGFTDTINPEILKAHALGIVNGVSDTKFKPNNNVSRQEIAVMFFRTLKAVDESLIDGIYPVNFEDKSEIASWAEEAIGFMSNKGIVGGVGNNLVNPKGNATREQAIALVVRTFEEFN
ncbi:S-layer family protein [Natranaerovirga pectinivora]|uniref:S-layer family protein n=1 Tax=Natranaerovirga pectinivora TaxID=682400 RepID=A0A4R3MQK0_9FIRM|nr:S-layer homology domain-containing protein [Natranaerovirga pectinivora]TCT17064.1 S-layer family protein [Natranaerovirga pectinivora]